MLDDEYAISTEIANILVGAVLRNSALTVSERERISELQSQCAHHKAHDLADFMDAEGNCELCAERIFTPSMLPFG